MADLQDRTERAGRTPPVVVVRRRNRWYGSALRRVADVRRPGRHGCRADQEGRRVRRRDNGPELGPDHPAEGARRRRDDALRAEVRPARNVLTTARSPAILELWLERTGRKAV